MSWWLASLVAIASSFSVLERVVMSMGSTLEYLADVQNVTVLTIKTLMQHSYYSGPQCLMQCIHALVVEKNIWLCQSYRPDHEHGDYEYCDQSRAKLGLPLGFAHAVPGAS